MQAAATLIIMAAFAPGLLVFTGNPFASAVGMLLFFITFPYIAVKVWLAPTILVVENKPVLEAIRLGFARSSGMFWNAATVLFTIGLVTGVVSSGLIQLPLVGYSLDLLASAFFAMWSATAPAAFYYEYNLGKKKPLPKKTA